MENTETNYTTNKTLMNYLKANIDVHINYLLFLNSFTSISNRGFMEIAPIIESLRDKMYQAFPNDLIPDDTVKVNLMVETKLASMLDEIGLSEIKDYIGFNLKKEDIINLTTSIFLRNSLIGLPSIKGICEEEIIIANTLADMTRRIPKTSIEISGYSFELASFFLESLRINASEEDLIVTYLYNYLADAAIINAMANRIDENINLSIETDFLRKELFQYLYLPSNFSLVNLVDGITSTINSLSKKQSKNLSLEKH